MTEPARPATASELVFYEGATIRKFRIVQTEGIREVTRLVDHYNLDVTLARQLNRIVTMYLDPAEEQAERRKPMYMRDGRDKVSGFPPFNERERRGKPGRASASSGSGGGREEP